VVPRDAGEKGEASTLATMTHPYLITVDRLWPFPIYQACLISLTETLYGPVRLSEASARAAGEALATQREHARWLRAQANRNLED
jgi:hypothetical protein